MLKSAFGKLKYLVLVLAFLAVAPVSDKAWAGIAVDIPISVADTDNDAAVFQLYYFWDLRGGESLVQLTNTGFAGQRYHVQVFNVAEECDEVDFYDLYTPFDTHVYDMRAIVSNDLLFPGGGAASPNLTGGYGFVVVSLVNGEGNLVLGNSLGNLRVIRDEGYEYRTNANALSVLTLIFSAIDSIIDAGVGPIQPAALAVPFNDVDGSNFSDVVGMPVQALFDINTFTGSGTVSAGGAIFASFSASIFNQFEQFRSCNPVAFACDLTDSLLRDAVLDALGSNFTLGFDLAINQFHDASRLNPGNVPPDGDTICTTGDRIGQLRLETAVVNVFPDPIVLFFGFYGLNNGDGTGSMDSFVSLPFFNVGFEDVFGVQAILETLGIL